MNNLINISHPVFGEQWVAVLNPAAKELYFSAPHVASALGYMNPQAAINKHCLDKCHYRDHSLVTALISEQDVFRLINHSVCEQGEPFRSWLVGDVLPYMHSLIIEQRV